MTSSPHRYARIETAAGRLDEALLELVAPLLVEIRSGSPPPGPVFFARFRREALVFVQDGTYPTGDAVWELVERRAREFRQNGIVIGCRFPEYEPEVERYGGEEGLDLAGRIFEEDSRAALALLGAEREGTFAATRREISLLLTERLLDLLRFDREARVSFYRFAYAWALKQGEWKDDEIRLLDDRYRQLEPGLEELLGAARSGDAESAYGGAEPARIAAAWADAARAIVDRLLEAHGAGRIPKDLESLAWSYSHMHCNRLGIAGEAEALLRFFMHRRYEHASEDGLPRVQ